MFKFATRIVPEQSAFELVRNAGISAVEIRVNADSLLNSTEIAQLAAGLSTSIVFPARLEVTDECLESCIELCHATGSQTLVIHEPMFEKFADQLEARDSKLDLAVENGPMPLARLAAWAEKYSRLTLDVEHFWKFSLNDCPLEQMLPHLTNFWKVYGGKIRQVHLPGYRPGLEVHRPMHANRELAQQVLTLLRDNNFQGMVVSEVAEEFFNHRELTMDAMLFEAWSKGLAVSV